ncbi:sarcosine oxidase subunit delta [Rhodophyticola sp.]|jgi:sarcosine oxidase subunit delta|uniref:sarcosine oxidase subunit delta n=1 Tax=Rhodophyticola sp. TaxID=2680032 RepID=UPI001B232157|nr:sarcosine oxidase subunit delta [Roseicyclus sp.]MBO6624751.1 sarcosine oxidase subunit delta [Roseicyclus sp.]MBO6921471.1 sarcosine oxidase subunit delta [Roseicyclus sp.]
MRITCPLCGDRDSREFSIRGHETYLDRPAPDAGEAAWDNYLHLRDNPAGETAELWHHGAGCAAWLRVRRNTVTHEVLKVDLVRDLTGGDHAD